MYLFTESEMEFWFILKQNSEVIPHSNHSFQTAKPKEKVIESGELNRLSDWEYQLSKGWEMIEGYKARAADKSVFAPDLDTSKWYSATVPGTVLTTLVDQVYILILIGDLIIC